MFVRRRIFSNRFFFFPSQQRPARRLAAEEGQLPNPGAQLPGGGAGLADHPHGVRRRRRGVHAAGEGQRALQALLWRLDR